MPMTGWCTVGASKKLSPLRPSSKSGLRSAAWKCIRRKPRSFTARMRSEQHRIRASSLTSSATAFVHAWSRIRELKLCFAALPQLSALHAMRQTIRSLDIRRRTHVSLTGIAKLLNPLLRGWIGYYGRYAPSARAPMQLYVNQTLVAWARRKFKRYSRKTRASRFIQKLAQTRADIFVHWQFFRGSSKFV